ncbi:hypothetical protein [Streptomyces laurentii]|uniref:hypothetical protein n=1 Tax=Streptomyces laurentii TaxID=39478 RepID=UPI003687376E
MRREPDPRTRSAPWKRWLIGYAGAAVGVAVLGYVAVTLLVSFALQTFYERPALPPEEIVGKQAGLTWYRLEQAIQDGVLTDQEISEAAGGEWRAERDRTPPRVVVKYPVPGDGKSSECHAFAFPEGTKAGAPVTREKLGHCPF